MMGVSDQQLLRDYAEHRSESAFAELLRRHIDLVYSVAVRMVCDAHLAQDVTQAVFVALARNAARLTDRPVLSGWLHRTARNLAAETVRTEVRRRAREQEAAMNDSLAAEPAPLWEDLAPHLDTVLDELSDLDGDAVLLRYFERRSAREMAHALGVSEDAAQKRVSRAVERLRELFAKRGVSVGAGGLVVLITANAIQAAPAGLVSGILAAASAATAGGSVTAGLLKLLIMTKLQTASVAVVLVGLILTPLVIQHQARLHGENGSLRRQLAQLESDNLSLSNQIAELKSADGPHFAALVVAASATKPQDQTPAFQQVTNFLQTHDGLPREQIEVYLQQNHRNTESLLAAFQVSHDPGYLREAATNAPTDPAVQCAVLAQKVFPEDQRKWIEASKASSPANALPWYFSALDYFQSKQPNQAIQELSQASRRQYYADYGAQTCQAVEEMYDSAGWPGLAAKASAPGTSAAATGPVPMVLKTLANETLRLEQQDFSQGDAASANAMAALAMALGDQLRRANAPIDQLMGIAIEKTVLGQLDPTGNYDFLGRPVSDVLSGLDQQKQGIRDALQIRDQVRPSLSESELNNYWEREKLYGELYAIQWLQSTHRQP